MSHNKTTTNTNNLIGIESISLKKTATYSLTNHKQQTTVLLPTMYQYMKLFALSLFCTSTQAFTSQVHNNKNNNSFATLEKDSQLARTHAVQDFITLADLSMITISRRPSRSSLHLTSTMDITEDPGITDLMKTSSNSIIDGDDDTISKIIRIAVSVGAKNAINFIISMAVVHLSILFHAEYPSLATLVGGTIPCISYIWNRPEI